MKMWQTLYFVLLLAQRVELSERFRPGKRQLQLLAFIQICEKQTENTGETLHYNNATVTNNTNTSINKKEILLSQVCKNSMDWVEENKHNFFMGITEFYSGHKQVLGPAFPQNSSNFEWDLADLKYHPITFCTLSEATDAAVEVLLNYKYFVGTELQKPPLWNDDLVYVCLLYTSPSPRDS